MNLASVYVRRHRHEDDWTVDIQAGVKIYINKNTGEVFDECPWNPDNQLLSPGSTGSLSPSKFASPSKTNRFQDEQDSDDAQFRGTGSLVYESSELAEVFDMLDSPKKSSKIINNI